LQVIRIDLIGVLPTLIFEFIPGAMKLLHFLQKTILRAYGIFTLSRMLIFLASKACRCANFGFVFALDIALSIRICIRSSAICFTTGFIHEHNFGPTNLVR